MNTSRTYVDLYINGENVAGWFGGDSTRFQYTDNAADEADDISITVQNREKRWMGPYLPQKGDVVRASIITENWNGTLDCGEFTIDDVGFSGWPLTMSMGALALPMNTDFSGVKKNRTWSDATLSEIARSAAGAVPLEYLASYDPALEFISQTQESDKLFLHDLCKKHGLTLKTYNNKVVIFDLAERANTAPVATLTPADLTGFSCKSTIANTGYGACVVRYTNTDGETLEYTATKEDGETDKVYRYDTVVDSLAEAQRVAEAKLQDENLMETTFSCTMPGNPAVAAGATVRISGFEWFDGTYFIDKSSHSVGGGYTTSIETHRPGG